MSSIVKKSIFQIGVLAKAVYVGLGEPSSSKWQYVFDGIDDYVQLPVIPLFVGDMVELDIDYLSGAETRKLIDDPTTPTTSRAYINISSANLITYNNTIIDIVNLPSGSSLVEGSPYSFKINVLADANLGMVGRHGTVLSDFANFPIKNLRITRANPTDQYPDLFWPMDDGPDTTVMSQTIPHNHKTDGTESFDSDGAVWLDYETEAAPQYAGVAGYETLAERAVLSGLSEHAEAVASCREGLVRNGDFRFGDNGGWAAYQDGVLTANNGVCTITAGSANYANATQEVPNTANGGLYKVTFDFKIPASGIEYGSFMVRVYDGNVNGTILYQSPVLVGPSGMAFGTDWVTHTFYVTASTSNLWLYPRANVQPGDSAQYRNFSIHKTTNQQVLSPYVNHGEYVNFNEENWENV